MAHNTVTLDDSPFSITGNVIGILTYLLGLIASYIAFHNLARDSDEEIVEFLEDVHMTSDQMAAIRLSIPSVNDELWTIDSGGLERLIGIIEAHLSVLLTQLSKGRSQLKGSNTFSARRKGFALRRKVIWLFRRRRYLAQMSKMRGLKAEVYLAQNTYLMKWVVVWVLLNKRLRADT